MKKTMLSALTLCLMLSMTGCTTPAPTSTPQPTTAAPTQAPTPRPTDTPVPATPAPTAEPTPEETMAADQAEVKDGTYRAEMSDSLAQAEQGWKGYLSMTVKAGEVTETEFDYLKDGKKKSELTAEEYPMTPPPGEWIPAYTEMVMKTGLSGEKIDVIAGATQSAEDVNMLYQALLTAAKDGNSDTVIVGEAAQESAS